jgi:ABC-type uncharacterized transport system ATPase subunit
LTLPAGKLSGGNQQKLIVAREFQRQPRVLIAAQPTRGVDVGAIEFIHTRIVHARDEGAGVLLVSSELDEILTLSDRILVMTYRPGKVKRVVDIELPRPRTSEIVGSEAFGRYVAQIWVDLREEASRGIEADEARVRRGDKP